MYARVDDIQTETYRLGHTGRGHTDMDIQTRTYRQGHTGRDIQAGTYR